MYIKFPLSLRQIDLEFLKRLQYKVNLIPVIAKSDTLTQQEVQRLKNNINKEIEENDIEIYQFPGMDIIILLFEYPLPCPYIGHSFKIHF